MRIGAVLPQGRILLDRAAVRAFAEAADDLGYTHLFCFDHVLGADRAHYPDRTLPYTTRDPFHEPFTIFSYLAAITFQLEFCTGVLVLPQRQTALVAKQAAEVDYLSDGRLRVGVATGWNEVEYQALGMPWRSRGRRLDEQIEILRLLWTQESVTYSGNYHQLHGAGINPLPVQRPIPVWVGGRSERALQRAALLGDGYLVPGQPPVDPRASAWPEVFDRIRTLRRSAGLDGSYGFEARPAPIAPDGWEPAVSAWEAIGTTHVSVTTLAGLRVKPDHTDADRRRDLAAHVDDHIADLQLAREALSRYF